jgi:quercetin dioxygenase-like cupin family protein
MRKKHKTIAFVLSICSLMIGASIVGSTLSAQSQSNTELKPEIFKIPSLLEKGLQNEDHNVKYTTLVRTDKVEVQVKSLTGFPKHFHKYENHFLYVMKGEAELSIGAKKTLVKTGDFIVIPPGKQYEHELKVIGDQPMQLLVFGTPPED